jgi:hypothetical protein
VGGVCGVHSQPGEEVHQAGHLRVVADDGDVAVAQFVGRCVRRVGAAEECGIHLVALAQDLGEELLLRIEVVQQARLAESHGVGDRAHRGAGIAFAPDDLEGALEDLLAFRDPFRVRTASLLAHGKSKANNG